MSLIFDEEVNEIIASRATIIAFFGLPEERQIEVLPVLDKEEKYDFPDGDLITDNALEVLVNDYNAFFNSILLRLDEPIDERINDKYKELYQVFDNLFGLTAFIDDKFHEDICNENILKLSEWNQLRKLSLVTQDKFNIHSEVNYNILKNRVDYWLHP